MVWCGVVHQCVTVTSAIYNNLRCVYVYSGSVTNCVIIDIDIDINMAVCASHSYL
jgi:hypothetical protein